MSLPETLWRLSAQEHFGGTPGDTAGGLARLMLNTLRHDAHPMGLRRKGASWEKGHDAAVSG